MEDTLQKPPSSTPAIQTLIHGTHSDELFWFRTTHPSESSLNGRETIDKSHRKQIHTNDGTHHTTNKWTNHDAT